MTVAVTVFSSMTDAILDKAGTSGESDVLSPLSKPLAKLYASKSLTQRLKYTFTLRLLEIFIFFLAINILGMVVAKAIVSADATDQGYDETDERYWSWMVAFYWSVQTTTTIGKSG